MAEPIQTPATTRSAPPGGCRGGGLRLDGLVREAYFAHRANLRITGLDPAAQQGHQLAVGSDFGVHHGARSSKAENNLPAA